MSKYRQSGARWAVGCAAVAGGLSFLLFKLFLPIVNDDSIMRGMPEAAKAAVGIVTAFLGWGAVIAMIISAANLFYGNDDEQKPSDEVDPR